MNRNVYHLDGTHLTASNLQFLEQMSIRGNESEVDAVTYITTSHNSKLLTPKKETVLEVEIEIPFLSPSRILLMTS